MWPRPPGQVDSSGQSRASPPRSGLVQSEGLGCSSRTAHILSHISAPGFVYLGRTGELDRRVGDICCRRQAETWGMSDRPDQDGGCPRRTTAKDLHNVFACWTRVDVLIAASGPRRSVTELADGLDLSRNLVSAHLKSLVGKGLLREE